jgi:hypothetical protein
LLQQRSEFFRSLFSNLHGHLQASGSSALYQGTTLVGPHGTEKEMGFSPCTSPEPAVTVH